MRAFIRTGLLVGFSSFASFSQAGMIEIEELGLFAHGDSWAESVVDMPIGDPAQSFASQGLSLTYTNGLDLDNIGTVVWTVENTSGSAIDDFSLFSYLNADIDFATNTFFNEHASYVGNTTAQSYEIDEPGYVFGDIFDNLLLGELDNSNAVPLQTPDDVSFALGFDLGRFEAGEMLQVTVDLSLNNIGGIMHADSDSNFSYYFNTTVTRSVVTVSEPASFALFVIGLFAVARIRWLKHSNMI